MSEESQYVKAGKEQLHYLEWGNGKRLLLAFHGYGDNAELYRPLRKYLNKDYTILSFDLPHHGGSKWTDGAELIKDDLVAMVKTLMAKYHVDKVSLLGYSMGGRVCLSIVAGLPAVVDKATLLAADGLTVNFYFWFFTRTFIGKWMFRNMLKKPKNYLWVMNWLKNMKLVDASRHKFVMHFLQSEESRDFLLKVWPAMSLIIPKPSELKQVIRQYGIPISLFMGAYDKIMPPSLAVKFKKGLDSVHLYIPEKGHRIFDNETARQIAESLL